MINTEKLNQFQLYEKKTSTFLNVIKQLKVICKKYVKYLNVEQTNLINQNVCKTQ